MFKRRFGLAGLSFYRKLWYLGLVFISIPSALLFVEVTAAGHREVVRGGMVILRMLLLFGPIACWLIQWRFEYKGLLLRTEQRRIRREQQRTSAS